MTTASSDVPRREGLPLVRLAMILSSLTPLFILWAVRGIQPIPERALTASCVLLIALPNLLLVGRLWIARKRHDQQPITIDEADDHRDHLLVYLFAMLLPLYDANLGGRREAAALIIALVFVVFLFWHLKLHYMNVFFAIAGYRVYTVRSRTSVHPVVLLTPREVIAQGTQLQAYRLSNTVYIERAST